MAEKNEKRMSVTLNEQRYYALQRAADRAGVTKADMINDAIDQYLLLAGKSIGRKPNEEIEEKNELDEIRSCLFHMSEELTVIKELLLRMEKE